MYLGIKKKREKYFDNIFLLTRYNRRLMFKTTLHQQLTSSNWKTRMFDFSVSCSHCSVQSISGHTRESVLLIYSQLRGVINGFLQQPACGQHQTCCLSECQRPTTIPTAFWWKLFQWKQPEALAPTFFWIKVFLGLLRMLIPEPARASTQINPRQGWFNMPEKWWKWGVCSSHCDPAESWDAHCGGGGLPVPTPIWRKGEIN